MNIKDALTYLNYAEKYGATVPDTEGMSDNEIIKLATWMQDQSDAQANSREE